MHALIVRRWFGHDCCAKMANTWRPNRLPCAATTSTMPTPDTSRRRNVLRSARTRRPCCRTWWRAISSTCCPWWSSAAGSTGCSPGSWRQRCHSRWRCDSSQCCSAASSWPRSMRPGCPAHRGTSWTCSACGAYTRWCWEKTTVR